MDALIAFFTTLADAIAHAAGLIPLEGWAAILALLISALVTQRAKFWIPLRWSSWLRAFLSQAIAFWSAVLFVWLLWPGARLPFLWAGLAVAIVIGIASPTLYAIAVRLIGKRWPEVRDLLSQDVRKIQVDDTPPAPTPPEVKP